MSETRNLRDALMGGPGLDGYAYQADVYCIGDGRAIIRRIFAQTPEVDGLTFRDSEEIPQPIFFGESDCAEHCAECGGYLYGEQEDGE